MNSKVLACAAAVSSAIAIWGCASSPSTFSAGLDSLDCRKNSCEVPTKYDVPGWISVPEVIEVDAKTRDTVVTVTWTLSSYLGAEFDPVAGIAFTIVDGEPKAACAPVGGSTRVFKCELSNLQPKMRYKYTVTLIKGFFPPWPRDPVIRNG